MESADDIRFIINTPTCETDDSQVLVPTRAHDNTSLTKENIRGLLTKIAGLQAAERVLSDSLQKVTEEEVEVMELQLTEKERLLLHSCSDYFFPDAWLAVGQNMQHSKNTENLLLPVYTTADERFWLFRSNDKPSRIAKCVFSTKIRGQWLDLQSNGTYSFVQNDVITGKSLVRSAHGPLYFIIEHCDNFVLPDALRSVILKLLDEADFPA